MIDVKNIAIFYAFDFPHYVELSNHKKEYRFYDEEILKSVKYWRKNAGWLKDINIYALTFGDIQLYNSAILQELNKYKTKIFNVKHDFNNDNWLKCVYAGNFFEKNIQEKILIRLDLDMYCLQPPHEDWFLDLQNNIKIGMYDTRNNLETRQIYYNNTSFDISLIISNSNLHFYDKYYQCYLDEKTFNTNEWNNFISKNLNYFPGYIGEYVIDYMNANKIISIMPIKNHYFGEGYRDITLYTNEEAKKICFLHEHIRKNTEYYDNYNPIKSMLVYLNKIKNA